MKLWDAPSYTFQHWIALRIRTSVNLLQARYDIAVGELDTETRFAQQAGLTEMQVVCIEAAETRGRAYLGAALEADTRKRAALLERVRKLARELRRIEGRPHALAPSYLLEAGILWLSASTSKLARSSSKQPQAIGKPIWKPTPLRPSSTWHAHAANSVRMETAARCLQKNGVACPERWARAQFPVEAR